MNQPVSFSIFDSGLDSRMIIEASAGTGKTYTIVGIFIRLLLEDDASPEEILIVTFTRMAAKELKDRILKNLRSSIHAIEKGKSDGDPFLADVIRCSRKRDDGAGKLREAIRNFDDAAIYTIHGFCQQVLSEESLISGMPLDLEVSQDDDFLAEAAEDFWRDFIYLHSGTEAGKYLISKLLELGSGPAEFLEVLKPSLLNHHAEPEADGNCLALDYLAELLDLRYNLAEIWRSDKNEIIKQLTESDVSGISTHLKSRCEKLEHFLEDDSLTEDSIKQFTYFLPSWFRNKLKKNKNRLPEHPFFHLCEKYHDLVSDIGRVSTWILQYAAGEIQTRRLEKSSDSSVLTYDDLVDGLRQSLLLESSGEQLAFRLRKKYPFALIDEFQDTDPAQYEIFDQIYPAGSPDSTLIMIGDPKQSIYAFRGADLYAYLRARNEVSEDSRYTLQRNYRSSPKLVDAVNVLFQPSHETPFLEEKITYHTIGAGIEEESPGYLRNGQPVVPLSFYYQEEGRTKEALRTGLFGEMVRQIRELVSEGESGRARLQDEKLHSGCHRNLTAGDIAVLVPSHRDAEKIKGILKLSGLGAVTYSREKVFESREAWRLEQIFSAVLDPAGPSRLQVALTTGFFGHRLSDIYRIQRVETELLKITETLENLHLLWHKSGCYFMARKLLFEYGALEHLSELNNSERVVTNLQQLLELSAHAEQKQGFDPPALLRWFREKMNNQGSDEEETLRLESEENLVKLTTIHNSKGLEFPVVFCPALWSAKDYFRRNNIIETYHRDESPYQLVVNLDQKPGERRTEAEDRAHFEEISEEVRKTYVALTRAKYECRIFWGVPESCNLTGLGAMLLGRKQVMEAIRKRIKVDNKKGFDEQDFIDPLKELAEKYPDLISFRNIEEGQPEQKSNHDDPGKKKYSIRTYAGNRRLRSRRTLYSFSSLVNHESEAASEPDYEQFLDDFIEYASGTVAESENIKMIHFPRGKEAGTFIHKLFEDDRFDFRLPEITCRPVITELSVAYGYDEKWTPALVNMMLNVTYADYPSLRLGQVSPEDMLKEMEFCFPVSDPDVENILSVIRKNVNNRTSYNRSKGFMTGFIDLIVRQKGIYYILDYKSNYLGDTAEDYQDQRLYDEMIKAGYDIQYHLYSVALKKYLEKKDPEFNYETDFGGVCYLFIRGMRAETSSGIFFDKPDLCRIKKLEEVLNRDE